MCTHFILDMASFEFIQYDDCTDLSYLFWCPFEGPYALSSAWKCCKLQTERQLCSCRDEALTSRCHVSGCSAALQQRRWSCYVSAVTKWQCSLAKGGKKGKTHLHQGTVWHWKLSCQRGPVGVRSLACGRWKGLKPARNLPRWRCAMVALMWEYN